MAQDHLTKQRAVLPVCVRAADYASVLGHISRALALGAVTRGAVVRIGVGYMGLTALAVVINNLTLRLPLIYYKQRRSKVGLLPPHTPHFEVFSVVGLLVGTRGAAVGLVVGVRLGRVEGLRRGMVQQNNRKYYKAQHIE